jgi:Na+-translocating ferredoxin:NAD+ oxidoreductase subunit D
VKHLSKTLEIRSSPHIAGGASTDSIMFNVVLALLPVCLFAVYLFGLAALAILSMAVVSCVLTEHIACRIARRSTTITDWSAAVTGLLYGMTLPPSLPLWMVAVGGVAGIGITKLLFGGLGYNCFNPALIGRALLQAAFPVAMTTWPAFGANRFATVPSSLLAWPLAEPVYDGLSGATPLSQWKFDRIATSFADMFLGMIPGSTGETSAILILLGGIYLAARGMLNWRIPAAILATVATASLVLHLIDSSRYAGPIFHLCSGGLMLGAVFMATDMVASPMTHRGCVVYGVLIGALVLIIRVWGGMPEGVMYAILLGNAVSPHIDNWIRPKLYGSRKKPDAKSNNSQATTVAQPAGTQARSEMKPEPSGAISDNRTPSAPFPSLTPSESTPILAMYVTLLSVGAICGLAIVSAYLFTQPFIKKNKINFRQRAVLAVLPGATQSQAFQWIDDGQFKAVPADREGADLVFAGYDQQQKLVGIALMGQRPGYQDLVELIFGYSFETQAILGFRVLASRETPGLGDRVETDKNFLSNFGKLDVQVSPEGDRLVNSIEFVKPGNKKHAWQIDGISGATISSRTVSRIVGDGAEYWVPRLWQRRADFEKKEGINSNIGNGS